MLLLIMSLDAVFFVQALRIHTAQSSPDFICKKILMV